MTTTKDLRVEQVLLILDTVGVEPTRFFAELDQLEGALPGEPAPAAASLEGTPPRGAAESVGELSQRFRELRVTLRGLMGLLVEKGLISPEEAAAAAEGAGRAS